MLEQEVAIIVGCALAVVVLVVLLLLGYRVSFNSKCLKRTTDSSCQGEISVLPPSNSSTAPISTVSQALVLEHTVEQEEGD